MSNRKISNILIFFQIVEYVCIGGDYVPEKRWCLRWRTDMWLINKSSEASATTKSAVTAWEWHFKTETQTCVTDTNFLGLFPSVLQPPPPPSDGGGSGNEKLPWKKREKFLASSFFPPSVAGSCLCLNSSLYSFISKLQPVRRSRTGDCLL